MPDVENYTREATVKFEASGHRTARYEGVTRLRFLTFSGTDEIAPSVTLGTDPPMEIAPGEGAEVYVSVSGDDRNGDFTIEKSGIASSPGRMANTVYVTLFKGVLGEATEGGRYDEVMTSCTGTMSDGGASGEVSCANLVDRESKGSIEFTFKWTARGEKKPEPTTTTSTSSASTSSSSTSTP